VRHKSLLVGLALLSCTQTPSDPDVTELPTSPVAKSARGNIRFKGPERINSDFSAILELRPESVCLELGLYACTSQVHLVALGGVDPYGAGVYESSGITASTTPIIVDRIAWAACTQRVNSDLGNPDAAVIFRGIPLADQKLASPDGPEVHSAITQLVQRTYLRNPYRPEVDRYVRLAKDIEAAGTATPAKDWMQSVCFAVLSSAESVFY
jgi:hypothetical protein